MSDTYILSYIFVTGPPQVSFYKLLLKINSAADNDIEIKLQLQKRTCSLF